MSRNILAGFLTMGQTSKVGTYGFGSRLTDLFISSLQGVANGIGGDLKNQLIKPLCNLNFDMTRRQYPSVIVQDLDQADLGQVIELMTKLTDTVLTPQDKDEDMLRKVLKMPPLDPSNRRSTKERLAAQAKQPGGEGGAPGGGVPAAAGGRKKAALPKPPAGTPDAVKVPDAQKLPLE